MVFSSFPVYLDHPNLHQFPQQPDHQQQGGSVVDHNGQVHQPPPPLAVPGGGGSIRPGSMVDRARLAKLPLPEAGLKCPRCDSTNTKFCYFNNYSLTQPRHFCKTCRRYWTRGGALRNVPVGGGCRRNKKTKSSGSKSSMAAEQRQVGSNINSANTTSPSRCSPDVSGHFTQTSTQLPFMSAFQSLNHYGGSHIGPTIGGFQAQLSSGSLPNMGFNIGSNNLGGNGNDLSSGGAEQWRLPNIGGFEPQTSLFPLIQGEGVEASSSMLQGDHMATSSSGMASQISSVKREENPAGLNLLTKQFLANSEGNQFWGGGSWTGFSGVNSASTSHLL